ncbi:MAG: hypothetical protein ABH969_02415 [Pseudomonadota bacterium]
MEEVVVPPSLIPGESGNKVKTDKRDSRKLAKLLENNLLKRVYVLSREDRADREISGKYVWSIMDSLVNIRIRLMWLLTTDSRLGI